MENARWICLPISAHSPGHTSPTIAGFMQGSHGLHKPRHPEVLETMTPLRKPSLTSTAHPRPLVIRPHRTTEYLSPRQLSKSLSILQSDIRFFYYWAHSRVYTPWWLALPICCSTPGRAYSKEHFTEESLPFQRDISVIKVFHNIRSPLPGSEQASTHTQYYRLYPGLSSGRRSMNSDRRKISLTSNRNLHLLLLWSEITKHTTNTICRNHHQKTTHRAGRQLGR